ncbi:hypothetical protein COV49_04120 [Candidatus Falkowbacteria bacterium CG11_big_fil_rev_8_21_14_0_20_39_10]|uniref:Aminoglycoside phosphotransferase domain-containing protein n=1 Tax=Candidatus Falkowbacteria bacterium CG11_big_fil_rev_8_21_14_0_20_39_10 TaxID=1974570 RepID=A0A2M6K881_9BACT|nr:MAG: hypothetical protein COV49_04120 [Candidatus Falkowbacteria bacterium CG11_big_fil_rev_8_21_14_0_20_39_10]
MKNHLEKEARQVAERNNFKINEKIYQAYSKPTRRFRNVIFSGIYKKKPAIFKFYSEERINDEPISLKFYNKINRNKLLPAPRLFKYKILSSASGWLIEEKISGRLFKSPLNRNERKKFLNLFFSYRQTFPKKSYKKLTLVEQLKPNEFHLYRINKWLKMANEAQAEDGLEIIKPEEFYSRYRKIIKLINQEFKNKKMIFCHGHFKPKEIFLTKDRKYYLTDFGHTKMYPEGYELAFIIWADYLMPADWKTPYKKWRRGVLDWINEIRPMAEKLNIKNYNSLIKASLAERVLGTILADIRAGSQPAFEQRKRIKLLYNLIDELI